MHIKSLSTLTSITLDQIKGGRKPAYHEYLHKFWRRMSNKKVLANLDKNQKLKDYIKELKTTVPEYSDVFQKRIEYFVVENYKDELVEIRG